MYRRTSGVVEVLLVHPGGPMWKGKDEHSWSIPKGEFEKGETPLEAAKRELREEVGAKLKGVPFSLGSVKTSNKHIYIFAIEQDYDASKSHSNTMDLEWPPKSGKIITIPEVDKAEWFPLHQAKKLVHKSQEEFISRLSVCVSER